MRRALARPVMLLSLLSAPAFAQSPVSADFSGRLYYDAARFENDDRGKPERDGDSVRAAWLGMSGKLFALNYKLEADFANDDVVARDVYLAYTHAGQTFTLGQFKQFYTLDDRGSTNHIPLIERSLLAQALAPGYRLGLGWNGHRGSGLFWAASAYSLESIDVWQTPGSGFSARAGLAPQRDAGHVLHLAVSAGREHHDHPGADGANALRVRPRVAGYYADNSRLTLVDFNRGRDVDATRYGLELAGVRGAWSWQTEYGRADYDDGMQRARIEGGYAQMSWLLTGESRPYDAKAGRFVQLKPGRESGAWELGLRYDRIDGRQTSTGAATVRDVRGESWAVGVNWYAQRHMRVMLDWTESRRRDRLADRTLDDTGTLAGRVQFDF